MSEKPADRATCEHRLEFDLSYAEFSRHEAPDAPPVGFVCEVKLRCPRCGLQYTPVGFPVIETAAGVMPPRPFVRPDLVTMVFPAIPQEVVQLGREDDDVPGPAREAGPPAYWRPDPSIMN